MLSGGAPAKIVGDEVPKDDGLGEREKYKDLDLLPEVDAMLHEHCEFLVNAGVCPALLSGISSILPC